MVLAVAGEREVPGDLSDQPVAGRVEVGGRGVGARVGGEVEAGRLDAAVLGEGGQRAVRAPVGGPGQRGHGEDGDEGEDGGERGGRTRRAQPGPHPGRGPVLVPAATALAVRQHAAPPPASTRGTGHRPLITE